MPLHAATVAASTADEQAKLAEQLNNPVAALISVPLQSNWDFGIGPKDAYKYTLKIQPVVPITLNADWNVISRTILPVIDAESPATGIDSASGLGDTTQSFFFSPKEPTAGGLIWGVGPAFLLPTASDDLLGNNQWGAGPTVVALKQKDGWTYGMLANQIWSFGASDEQVSALFVQPFVSYTTKMHTTFSLNTESTYDWENRELSAPINLAVAQLVKIGEVPVQFQLGGRWYADGPDGGPEWGLRFAITFLFPKS
ncbi:MAG: transporter [Luteolibacter sp.]|uniref:transporter n=1 Tax=Luteolibacter sp. TaxID=1962973 RepID=UPI003263D991